MTERERANCKASAVVVRINTVCTNCKQRAKSLFRHEKGSPNLSWYCCTLLVIDTQNPVEFSKWKRFCSRWQATGAVWGSFHHSFWQEMSSIMERRCKVGNVTFWKVFYAMLLQFQIWHACTNKQVGFATPYCALEVDDAGYGILTETCKRSSACQLKTAFAKTDCIDFKYNVCRLDIMWEWDTIQTCCKLFLGHWI